MSKFEKHFKMEEADAIEYAKEKLSVFDKDANLTCKEIGDGNINYIFRVKDENTGKSVIIKHADTHSRSGGTALDTVHNSIEAEILKIENELAPGYVPEVYYFDPIMCCITMEDVGEYRNMRHALCDHEKFPGFAEQIVDFMVKTLMGTSDLVMFIKEKRVLAQQFTNPDCDNITERLVYTYPYKNIANSNVLFEPDKEFLEKELYDDNDLIFEVAKLKNDFQCNNECLIHGDLHTGSIMIKQGSIKVLDPEFATYGPAGYDVGNVIANLIFAWTNAIVSMEEGKEKDEYVSWLEETIKTIVDKFRKDSLTYLKEHTSDVMYQSDEFINWFITGVMNDTAGVTGLELIRRTIGSAKVKDVAGLSDPNQRSLAERICVYVAKECIKNRTTLYQKGDDYLNTMHQMIDKAKASY